MSEVKPTHLWSNGLIHAPVVRDGDAVVSTADSRGWHKRSMPAGTRIIVGDGETLEPIVPTWKKILNPGKTEYGQLFIEVSYGLDQGSLSLSISGVEGPMSNGDARGSSGQCIDALERSQSETWTVGMVEKLVRVWNEWHLNSMTAGCPHQRAAGWGKEKIELVTYKLDGKVLVEQGKRKRAAEKRLLDGETVTLSDDERDFLALPYTATSVPAGREDLYKVDKRETKHAGWVRADEHPRGVLSKPCEVCGFPYGNAWLYRPVPADVLEWLQGLPDTTIKPAWV